MKPNDVSSNETSKKAENLRIQNKNKIESYFKIFEIRKSASF